MVDEMLVFGASSQPTDSGEQKIVLAGIEGEWQPAMRSLFLRCPGCLMHVCAITETFGNVSTSTLACVLTALRTPFSNEQTDLNFVEDNPREIDNRREDSIPRPKL